MALAVAAGLSGIVALSLVAFAAGGPRSGLSALLVAAGSSGAWLGGVALAAAALSPEPLRSRLGLVRPRLGAAGWGIGILGGLAASQAADVALRLAGAGRGTALGHVLSLLAGARGLDLALALVLLGGLAGVSEELLFRGYAQRRLVARFGPVAGIGLAAAAFALGHFDPQHAAFAFVFGAYLGFVATSTGSTLPGIAIHVANNALSVILAAAALDDARTAVAAPWLAAQLLALVGLALACAAWIHRRARAAGLDAFAGPRVGSGP